MRVRYDIPEDEPPSAALVMLVGELIGIGPTDMEPLHRLVDLDAVNKLLERSDHASPMSVSVRLELPDGVLVVDESSIVVEFDDDRAAAAGTEADGVRTSDGASGRR